MLVGTPTYLVAILLIAGCLVVQAASLQDARIIKSNGTILAGTEFGVEFKFDWGTGGVYPKPTVDMAKMADMIKALGAKWVRLYSGLSWENVEQAQGQYKWDYLDYVMNLYQSRGIEPLYIAAGTPRWAASGDGSNENPPRNMSWYGNFCYEVVARYNLSAIELLNEPYYYYNGTVAQYVSQIQAGSLGAKQANPNCTVLAGYGGGDMDDIYAFSTRKWLAINYSLDALVQQGFFQYIDGLVIHPYSERNPPETLEPQWDALKQYLAEKGKADFPIYATEWGYPADLGLDTQADYIVRSAEMQQRWGVKMSIYFDFFNTLVGQGGWNDKELVFDWNLAPRPSYYAYRDFLQQNST